MPSSNSQSLSLVSKYTIFPETKSTLEPLKLSVSDLPMLSTHYIQKGLLFTRPRVPFPSLLSLSSKPLSPPLSLSSPPLAGRLTTDSSGHVFIACNDAGADFLHVSAPGISIVDILSPVHVPDFVKEFFDLDRTVSYEGHFRPILAVQVTELADGIFIGCSVNHAVTDGTSLWNFFNTFAEVCRGARRISRVPDFRRESVLISPAVLRFPDGCPKQSNDTLKIDFATAKTTVEISSFQSLCALLWRAVTRARKLPAAKKTTFRMAVNVRHRVDPKLDPLYFGNAIQSIPTYATAREVRSRGLRWCAEQLNKSVVAYDDAAVKRVIEDWESDPKCFPLGNFDGAILTMGSSPRFPMYDNNFGWGRPMAIRSGRANKFDGKISAFPGREGSGSVDLEVLLAPETMAGLESDPEFMQYVSGC
ncbi:HXXXD-type acyl-transferase family protein [Actinidia rufa]|uniref:HXXXD-type acyl-transferase family protein n=1 Tax=Actinidia rufa TaxID=165716 RepID=A0A7J0GVU8_9ERIC|nr:HXXXD-type acyl-transferase family protein [Actinidia rufa]